MTPEQQRIAIAEWCGWQSYIDGPYQRFWNESKGETIQDAYVFQMLPDFCNDLNAMHEAESCIMDTRRGMFNAELSKLAAKRNLSSAVKEPQFIFDCIHATAAQRAEALLRTIGKWTDQQKAPTEAGA